MDLNEIVRLTGVYFERFGYLTIFLGSLIEITPLGWIVPGGMIIAIAGFFANGENEINIVLVLLIGALGALTSFLLSYLLGLKTGMWLVNKLKQEKNAGFAKTLLAKHGGVILTTSMMANLTRFWIAYIGGVEKYNFWKFFTYAGAASLTWSSLMGIIGYIAGFERQNIESAVGALGAVGWIFFIVAAIAIQRSIKHEYKHFKEDIPHNEKG